jgi:hypothetical protein
MALKIFISYSTLDLPIVSFVQSILDGTQVEVFVAEYGVAPGQPLSLPIINAIKQCDLFLLIWSKNSKASDWVPQEIGIAKAENKRIMPVLLQSDLKLPGFISDLKYLDVPKDPRGAFTWLRDNVLAQATEKQNQEAVAWLALGGALLWLLSRKG